MAQGALRYDAIDDRVTIPNSVSLQITAVITVEAWVFPRGAHQDAAGGIWHDLRSAWDNRLLLENNGAVWAQFHIGGSVLDIITPAGAVPLNQWSYVAFTYDGAQQRIFVNGVQSAANAKTGSISISLNNRIIGRGHTTVYHFNGDIDEVRISNIARTPAEIAHHWNGGAGRPFEVDANTRALWSKDEGAGPTIFDKSPNANNGTITGATWVAGFPFPTPPAARRRGAFFKFMP